MIALGGIVGFVSRPHCAILETLKIVSTADISGYQFPTLTLIVWVVMPWPWTHYNKQLGLPHKCGAIKG